MKIPACVMNSDRKVDQSMTKYYISLIVAAVFIVYTTSGYTGERAIFTSMGLCMLWIMIAAITNHKKFISVIFTKKAFSLILFLLFYTVTSFLTAGSYNTLKYIGYFIILFSPMLMFSYYVNLCNGRLLKQLLYFSLGIWVVYCLRALNFYYTNPGAARRLVADNDAFGEIAIGGGYPLAIGSAVFAVFLFNSLLNNSIKYNINKLITIITTILLVLVVIETRSTITVLGLVFGMIICLMIKAHSSSRGGIGINYRSIITFCVTSILFISVLSNINRIGVIILNLTTGSDNALLRRLQELGLELAYIGSGTGGSNYLWDRLSLLTDSFSLFLKSPFIGNGYQYGYDFRQSIQFGIGNHSEWFDILAIYGLLGGLPFLLIYYYAFKSSQKYSKSNISSSYIFVILFLGFFNPFKSFQAHLIIFFIIPSLLFLFNKREPKTKEG